MENIAIITSGFLPVPATNGGAVENLLQNIIKENEIQNKFKLKIFSIFDEGAKEECSKYKNTDCIFVKVPKIISFADRKVFFIAKNL